MKSVAQNTFNIDNGELLSCTAIILENHRDYKGFLWPKIDWHMLLCTEYLYGSSNFGVFFCSIKNGSLGPHFWELHEYLNLAEKDDPQRSNHYSILSHFVLFGSFKAVCSVEILKNIKIKFFIGFMKKSKKFLFLDAANSNSIP